VLRHFAYACIEAPASQVWAALARLEDITLLSSESQVIVKGGRLGRLLEPLLAAQIRRAAPRALAAFAYLVTHGEPPRVPHAKLPRVTPVC
jgi:hypothetical protein